MDTSIRQYLTAQATPCREGVFYRSEVGRFVESEEAYLKLRDHEGRLYSDEMLRNLPEVRRDHPLYKEWRIRASSLNRLLDYLALKPQPLSILDIGCGNGWMSNQLANRLQGEVVGLDTNRKELEQGARVFVDNPGLFFVYGDLFESLFPEGSFDIITLAGSVQYFPDVEVLMDQLYFYMKAGGEVHIMDSPFYKRGDAEKAKQRSIRHFAQSGFPEMAQSYYHPLYAALKPFAPTCLYNPKTLKHRIERRLMNLNLSPFRWIRMIKP